MTEPINVVVDVSHHNGNPNFANAKADGIVGVIHKATQGLTGVDPMYAENREKALDAGLLWGAYHFGVHADGSQQADHFLDTVKPDRQTLLVLDYEPNGRGDTMTLNQARDFVAHVNTVVGRFPGLYSSNLIKEQLGGQHKDPIPTNCFLWLAQYASTPSNIPTTWSKWTFWQYTDGMHGPERHPVNGIGHCDRNKFNGSLADLKTLWGVDH
jgi:lysozyme